MIQMPIIVRIVLAKDWLDALKTLWIATFGRIAANRADMMTYIKWPERQRLCRAFAEQCIEDCNDEELAIAWHCLAEDPAGPELYRLIFRALASAIVADPALLDDGTFAEAVAGWRFLANNPESIHEQDSIAAARARGTALIPESKAETLAWARIWAEARP